MDSLEIASSESHLRLHDSCFARCVQSLGSDKLDATEQSCIKNCFKSYAYTFKLAQAENNITNPVPPAKK